MSLITSCPACGTMFRVVPDQLRISEGWVRCGHCAEIFDATAHMADHLSPEVREALPTQPGELPEDWDIPLSAPPAAGPVPPKTPAALDFANITASRPTGFARSAPAAAVAATEGPESEPLEASPLDAPFVFRRSDLDHSDPVPSVSPPIAPRARESRPASLAEPADIDQVSFVRQARRRAFWRRPGVRLSLMFLSLVLAFALVLQLAYQDRDRLAVAQPQLKPWLEQMCEWMQCRLGPSRQIEAIVIESSSFNKLRSDAYRLSFTLRNTAAVEVATPAMELTLTDAQDQPLMRRVLTPEELGAKGRVIDAASDWTGAVGLTVAPGAPARIAGYRLLAFYP
ncbi:DUF3426 domain-containing protein [Caenimonas sedimenti]|uniref:DUF3426 domain-containing protein n=1 Tax=Caenimonas sedimenti TaxID=2596921 RepID=UPI001644D8C0|nr:DUF3426 domain-containing protein [Caenimonas sedimenti]